MEFGGLKYSGNKKIDDKYGSISDQSLHTFISRVNSELIAYFRYILSTIILIAYRMKVMLVGEENIGKTTLVQALFYLWDQQQQDQQQQSNIQQSETQTPLEKPDTQNQTDAQSQQSHHIQQKLSQQRQITGDTVSTDGIDIATASLLWDNTGPNRKKRLPEQQILVNVNFWDFAGMLVIVVIPDSGVGQELYYVTHQFFLSSVGVYLVLYDARKTIANSRVEFWLHSISGKVDRYIAS